jgi:hypothetical protein
MTDPDRQFARKAILDVVRNQIRLGEPPETKQTYDRLIAEGHSHEETMKLLGCVVAAEVFDILKRGEAFNQARFVAALEALPELPG